MKQTTVRLPAALLKRAQHFAVDADNTVQALIIEALEEYLKTHKK
ncbi:MAG TPA: hypothetical protein VMV27_15550 [Candidatus Binataceae bacterium]|nr:hypothetical protein [Candidatus Binataceae bacterium]